jgi:hypothetical protein
VLKNTEEYINIKPGVAFTRGVFQNTGVWLRSGVEPASRSTSIFSGSGILLVLSRRFGVLKNTESIYKTGGRVQGTRGVFQNTGVWRRSGVEPASRRFGVLKNTESTYKTGGRVQGTRGGV